MSTPSQSTTTTTLPIRILTHNIRYATLTPFPNEKPWPTRLPVLLSQLKYHTFHAPSPFICLQEVLHNQLVDILAGLNNTSSSSSSTTPKWAHTGVARTDGHRAGEYSPLLYQPSTWTLHSHKTIWLSPTPNTPGSKGWDAASIRILTVAHFTHRATDQKVLALCTHLDDQGVVARRESAKLILKVIEEEGNGEPVFLAGDLNSERSGEAYGILNGEVWLGQGEEISRVRDVVGLGPRWRYGEGGTFTGFEGKRSEVIDFVFVGPGKSASASGEEGDGDGDADAGVGWEVEGYTVLPNRFEDGVYSSDHRAVVADVVLRW